MGWQRTFWLWLVLVLVVIGSVPRVQAQEAGPLYFPATGHTLNDSVGFLSFWQAHNGETLLGLPVSEPLTSEAGTSQYFERGRLEQQLDVASGVSTVVVGAVAREYTAALYRTFASLPPRPEQAGVRYFKETGHTLRAPFLAFWEASEGAVLFGPPISEPLWETTSAGRRQVQYFANVRIERDASLANTADEMLVSDLGRALAELNGIATQAIANPGYAEAGPAASTPLQIEPLGALPTATPVPAPTAVPAAAPAKPAAAPRAGGAKWILVNLSDQWLYAYEGNQMVFDAPVATGRDGMETPTGNFAIYAKLPMQTMDGVTDGEYWVVPNVPHVMYIYGGVALHGTYWHNLFGTGARPSHGCVNLPLKSAAWLYKWAPMGTPVRVTY
jgi:lipoprotein-anchoring transpeptidase ErfK/SrfK